MQLVDGFPASPQKIEADIAAFVDIGMQNSVEALDFRRFNGVFLRSIVAEGNFGIPVERSLLVGKDSDMQLSDRPLIGKTNDHVVNFVLVVFLDIDLHPPLGCDHVCCVLLALGLFLLLPHLLEFTYHCNYIN